jgi:hypothetical protein
MGQRGTGLAGERVLRTQCAAAAGSRRCGQSRSLRQVAAARSSRCRPRLFPRCGRGRAVSESGGGRLPRHSPLGGGRASDEGAQQPQGLELASISPHTQLLMF